MTIHQDSSFSPERAFEDPRGFLARLYRQLGVYAVAQELGLSMEHAVEAPQTVAAHAPPAQAAAFDYEPASRVA